MDVRHPRLAILFHLFPWADPRRAGNSIPSAPVSFLSLADHHADVGADSFADLGLEIAGAARRKNARNIHRYA